MKEYAISLDCGKHSVKAIGMPIEGDKENLTKVKFRTKMYNLSDGFVELQGNSYKATFEDETYIVGDQGKEDTQNLTTDKTTKLHRLCSYVAITKFLKPNTKENKINLVLACPVSVLKNATKKEEYRNFIKGTGIIKIEVNDKKYEFEIVNVFIKAEGSGILYMKEELFKDSEVAVIDFGGLNMSFGLYVNGACKPEDRFADKHGAIKLVNYVRDDLTNNYSDIITTGEAERVLERGYKNYAGSMDKTSMEILSKSKKRFFDEAVELVQRYGYDLYSIGALAFVGGTTLKIQNEIKEKFPHANIETEWSTAEGLFRIAVTKYVKKKVQ